MRFFRALFVYLMNNERLISRLAESKPMRRAAQLVVYILARTGTLHGPPRSISNPQEFMKVLKNIAQTFKEDFRKIKDDIKKKPPN